MYNNVNSNVEIEREQQSKHLSIGNLPSNSDNHIEFSKNNEYFNCDPAVEDEVDLGLSFVKNSNGIGNSFEHDNEPIKDDESNGFGSGNGNDYVNYATSNSVPLFNKPEESGKTFDEIQQEKAYFLSQLKRMEKRGMYTFRRLSMENSLEEVKSEFIRIKKEIDMQGNVQFAQQGLLFCVSGIERMSSNFTNGKMDGWSQSFMTDMDSYDDVLSELCEKYSGGGMPPEMKLLFMLGGSGFMFYQQKALVDQQSSRQEYEFNDKKYTMPTPTQKEMQGPSKSSEELLRKFKDLEDDNRSISSSKNGGEDEEEVVVDKEVLSVPLKYTPPKGRGRPKKAK